MNARAIVIALLGAAALAVPVPAAGAEPVRLTIAQALGAPPALTLFLDVVDARDQPPASLDPASLTATIGTHRATVVRAEPFESAGAGAAYIFMVDVSRSIGEADMARVRESLRAWSAASTGGADRFALLAFGDDVETVLDFTADRAAFARAAASLAPRARTTQLHTAIRRAIDLSRREDAGLPARRVAVLLSDGQDEGSGLTADDVAALLREERLAIYAIGFSRLPGAARARGFDALLRFARNSGGQFREAVQAGARDGAGRGLPDIYAEMRRAVTRVFAVALRCDACVGDGQRRRLEVQLAAGTRVLTDGLDLRLTAAALRQPPGAAGAGTGGGPSGAGDSERIRQLVREHEERQRTAAMIWSAIALGLAAAGAGAIWWWLRRRRRRAAGAETDGNGAASADARAAAASTAAAPSGSASDGASRAGADGIAVTCHFRGRGAPPPLTVTLRDQLLVGADAGCAIVIADDDDVAERHCELTRDRGHVTLRQIDPVRPTLVNGAALGARSRYRLESGDVLLVGRTELRLMFGEAPL